MRRILGWSALLGVVLLLSAPGALAQTGPTLGSVDWVKVNGASGEPNVRFHLHWTNPEPTGSTVPVSGIMKSQEFGVFLPDYGVIGTFHVPAIAASSFFDVFFEVPLSQLPPEPQQIRPGPAGAPLAGQRPPGALSATTAPCLPDTIWDGNVDVIWSGAGVSGEVVRHFGDLVVCPGGGPTYIHVRSTDCAIGAPWSVAGLCPGFSATLVNEDLTPAPNPIPPGWTGYISVSAVATVLPGTTCCFMLNFSCDGRPATIDVCATACDCGNHGPTLDQVDWHNVGSVVRFHLRWGNPSPNSPTMPVSGQMMSQEFGVFLPDYGPIGAFNVPPIQPNSFFDVFFDVPLDALPQEPLKILPGGAPGAPGRQPGALSATSAPCLPDTIWDGNVDVIWSGPGGTGQVLRHFSDLVVCPGGGPTLVHVKSTTCAAPAPWSVSGLCPGFSATLVNEDLTPAPNPIPPAWTGFISVTAVSGVTPGTMCCFVLQFDCAGSVATLDVCATACECGNHGPTLDQVDWHNIGGVVRFHLRWGNPSPNAPTVPVSGTMMSQEFGVFMPNFGPIGGFSVPSIAPNSFFDVFTDVPLAALPPEPLVVSPATGPLPGVPCPQDTIWNGNMDIVWNGPGVTGHVDRHFGDVIVCSGGPGTMIHVKSTTCGVGAPWSVTGLCPGFGVQLLNEDLTPAPNPIPPGWTGFVSMSAAAVVAPGTTCCFALQFDCAGVPAVLNLCVTACDCGALSVPPTKEDVDFGIRSTVPTPTSGSVAIRFAIAREGATRLEVFDSSGRRVSTLIDGTLSAGPHTIKWDGRGEGGRNVAGGAYFIKLSSNGLTASRKVLVVR